MRSGLHEKVYKIWLIKFAMGLEKESTVILNVPRCLNPEKTRKYYAPLDIMTCPIEGECPYKEHGIHFKRAMCTYDEKSNR